MNAEGLTVRIGGETTFAALLANTGARGTYAGPGLYEIRGGYAGRRP